MDPVPNPAAAPILLVGTPRSGSTWVGEVLSHTDDVCAVVEPDNETQHPFAVRAKAALGRWPVLDRGDAAAGDYGMLWDLAFAGVTHRRTPSWAAAKLLLKGASREELRNAFSPNGHFSSRLRMVSALARPPARPTERATVLVKSVHAPLALEWIASRCRPRVLLVQRHPLNVIASWGQLGWGGLRIDRHPLVQERYVRPLGITPLDPGCSHLAAVTWQIALLTVALQSAAARHPEWHVVSHEDLCADPEDGFARLCTTLGLDWGDGGRRFLAASNRPGTGTTTFRVAADQPERWRHRLDDSQVREVRKVLDGFPLPSCAEDVSTA
ncbi:MAG: sulfotransferase [Acidimicrobiia bacterium]